MEMIVRIIVCAAALFLLQNKFGLGTAIGFVLLVFWGVLLSR